MNTPVKPFTQGSLSNTTEDAVEDYLTLLGEQDSMNLYRQVIDEVELPLLKAIMKHTRGNQSRAANCLGVNRATLRSKLKRHGLL
ncbi:MAG TPA: Fis family transcriptional regulator [Leucothrix mucor]|uniref:Putative Fis-like DNA-binding protein n=1 Tax=Leucothrix mucor TaxID=45248 RepID=A0A7V2WVE8_LEUMU|nr:Fis family transcriptional regulator [Leucothrix mucor]